MASSAAFVGAASGMPAVGHGPQLRPSRAALQLRCPPWPPLMAGVASRRLRPATLPSGGPTIWMAAGKKREGARGGSSRKKKRTGEAAPGSSKAAAGSGASAPPEAAAMAPAPTPAKARAERTTMADNNPGVPRTADDIKAAYTKKMAEKPKDTKSWLERIYIISPFASQTGQKPPWYLNPNITFVIVFIVVGVAFYVVVKSGGVHQGYVNGAPPDVNPFTK
ncbi:hypothetical protein MMPV_008871 [Pyropia vietnamensis]